jgi:hypothetical protein
VALYATVIDGSYFEGRRPNPALAYGQAKYIAALWMASMARQHPNRRFVTMSPGNTGPSGLTAPSVLKRRAGLRMRVCLIRRSGRRRR